MLGLNPLPSLGLSVCIFYEVTPTSLYSLKIVHAGLPGDSKLALLACTNDSLSLCVSPMLDLLPSDSRDGLQ